MCCRLVNWFNALSPRGQWAAGCAGILAAIATCLYSLGLVSLVVRPMLVATPPPSTVVISLPTVVRPTLVLPTSVPTIVLPGSTLQPTPTQAPLPTRAPTNTPTPEGTLDPFATPVPVTVTPESPFGLP